MTIVDFRSYPVQVRELYDLEPGLARPVRDIFGFFCSPQPLTTLVHQMDVAGVSLAVLATVDCTVAHGASVVPNEVLASLVGMSDRFVGMASVDPSMPDAGARLRHAVDDLGLVGLNVDPALQQFDPGDERRFFPVLQVAADLGIPVSVQAGLNWAPSAQTVDGRPGRLEPAVAAFPSVSFVLAHCGWPYVDEALALAIKYPNVLLDTSVLFGGRPESSVRAVLVDRIGLDVIEASLREQLVFASDYPRVDPKRMVRAVNLLGLREATQAKVLGANALSILPMSARKEAAQ